MSNKIHGLVAVITYRYETRGNRQIVSGSNVYIALKSDKGNIGVASAVLGGNYNAEQALKEFQKQPQRFAKIDAGYDMAKAMNLC